MDELWKLESDDTGESRRVASRLQTRLKASREPTLLNELVELYFRTGSKRARKILTTLREAHSQDFFDKLNDSVTDATTRLPALKLLAHTLNSQTSWLYRIVDHPLFTSILNQLKTSGDVVVLSNALFVVSAILPTVPSYISGHLHDIFAIFCDLATLRTTNRLGLTPKELHLHLDVAVYYFFMQLYALFPCNLSQFLRAHYAHSSQEEVAKFQEYIVPLFYQVQLHPGLITGGEKYELSKAKWGAMEPLDIATLGLQLCLDTSLAVQEDKPHAPAALTKLSPVTASTIRDHESNLTSLPYPQGLSTFRSSQPPSSMDTQTRSTGTEEAESFTDVPRELVKTPSTPLFLSHLNEPASFSPHSNETSSNGRGVPVISCVSSSSSCEHNLNLQATNTQSLSGLPDPSGFKTPQELDLFWSPSVTLGNTSSAGKSISHDSSRTSLTQQSLQPSNISSPISDSAVSSAQPTPGPMTTTSAFTFKNYSPTASVDGESLMNRQMVQSAVHTPSCLEDSHSSTSLEPLSQSMRADLSFRSSVGTGSGLSSPSQSLMGSHGSRSQLSGSFRARLGRFINFLSPKKAEEDGEGVSELSSTAENEEFTEICVNDLERAQQRSRMAGLSGDRTAMRSILTNRGTTTGAGRKIEVGEECIATEADSKNKKACRLEPLSSREVGGDMTSSCTGTTSEPSGLKAVKKEREKRTKTDEESHANDILKISNLPDTSRSSRTSSQSSQGSNSHGVDCESPLATHHPLLPELGSEDHLPGERRVKLYSERGLASSVPERGAFSVPKKHHSRSRSSNSDHTVLMVQERLQELVESEKNSSLSQSGESILGASGSSTVVEQSGGSHVPLDRHPTTLTVTSNDSTSTLRVQSPEDSTNTGVTAQGVVKPANIDVALSTDSNASLKLKTKSTSALSSLPSRLFIRRVSVCHPDHRLASSSSCTELSNQSTNRNPTSSVEHPSPLSLLDQFVARGEVLHRGQFESIPLTELEGVDWNHFGGCPHSEEFGMMRSQVALLHSQLLFERHQCLQHAKRNRRLLSRARSATQVAEKLYSLRDQLHQKEQLVDSLREHLQEQTSLQQSSNAQKKLSTENQTLLAHNSQLKEKNLCLSEENHRLKQHNEQLLQELKRANERLTKMENERRHMEPKLRRADQLQSEVNSLSCELQVLGELYQQQREEAQSLMRHSQREQELSVLCASMRREKEASQKSIALLSQQLEVSQARSEELEKVVLRREEEIESLRQKMVTAQGKYQAKMKALQDKYTSIVAIGQQLETQILELRGRPAHHKKKYTTRHQRSSSHPAVGVPHPPRASPSNIPSSKLASQSLIQTQGH